MDVSTGGGVSAFREPSGFRERTGERRELTGLVNELDGVSYSRPQLSPVARQCEADKPLSSPRTATYFPDGVYAEEDSSEEDGLILRHRVRVSAATWKPRRVDTKQTIASWMLGEESRIEAMLFWFICKNSYTKGALCIFWWVGFLGALFTILGFLAEPFIFVSLLMIPMPLCAAVMLSTSLLAQVMLQFELKVITVLQVLLLVSGMRLLGDRRCVFFIACFPTFIVASFVDAYPARHRQLFQVMLFSGKFAILASWDAILVFGLCQIHDHFWYVGEVRGKLSSFTLTTSVTLLIFCYRHLKTAAFSPHCFVLLKSPVESKSISVEMELDRQNLKDFKPELKLRKKCKSL